MGREVSPTEHNMRGRVFVARPTNPRTKLPPELQERQDIALIRIQQLKQEMFRPNVVADVGNTAMIDDVQLPDTELGDASE